MKTRRTIMNRIWEAYYRFTMKENYEPTVSNAKLISLHIAEATVGTVASRHNVDGETIRGWHKPPFHS